MNRKLVFLVITFFAFQLFMGCSQEPQENPKTAEPEKIGKAEVSQLATVSGEVISPQDFTNHLKTLPSKKLREIVGKEGKIKALQYLINEKLLFQEALTKGFDKNQKVLDELEKMKRGIVLREFLQSILTEDIPISDEEVTIYFNEHRNEYDKPEKVRVSHIVTPDKVLAEQILTKINQGESFKALAKKHSVDSRSNYKYGDLGYINRGRMPVEFDKAAFAMKKEGEISDIIKTKRGYHIIRFNARIDAFKSSLSPSLKENVKGKIKQKNPFSTIHIVHAQLFIL